MKCKIMIVVATAAAFVGSVAAKKCSMMDQVAAYSTLTSVSTLSSFRGCSDDSGFSLLYSTSLPTDAQHAQMCASSKCQSLISSVAALVPPDCDSTIPTSGLVLNVYGLVSNFSSKCSSIKPITETIATHVMTAAVTLPSSSNTPVVQAEAC